MRDIPPAPDHDIELSGGALALDFANTGGGGHVRAAHDPLPGDGVGWSLPSDEEALDRPLWEIARSAADLLTSGERDRVKECASTTCEWVFLDKSRNRSRRWCDMSDCGNRAKARRFHAKKRASA